MGRSRGVKGQKWRHSLTMCSQRLLTPRGAHRGRDPEAPPCYHDRNWTPRRAVGRAVLSSTTTATPPASRAVGKIFHVAKTHLKTSSRWLGYLCRGMPETKPGSEEVEGRIRHPAPHPLAETGSTRGRSLYTSGCQGGTGSRDILATLDHLPLCKSQLLTRRSQPQDAVKMRYKR